MLACFVDITPTMVGQAGKGARDREVIRTVERCAHETEAQIRWLSTRMKQAAPQALLISP
ncbi:MAG: hypothetical protein ACRDYU_05415 [Actinomycetes bacterium]